MALNIVTSNVEKNLSSSACTNPFALSFIFKLSHLPVSKVT